MTAFKMERSSATRDRVRQSLSAVHEACGQLAIAPAGQVALAIAQQVAEMDDVSTCNTLIELSRVLEGGQAASRWPLCSAVRLLFQRSPAALRAQAAAALTSVLLPFLATLDAAPEQRRQVMQAAVAVIAEGEDWGLACQLLQAATHATAAAPCSLEGKARDDFAASIAAVPGPVQAELAADLLAAACSATSDADELLACAGSVALPAALRTLCSDPAGPLAAAIGRHLLPALLAAAQRRGSLDAMLALLWETCRRLTAPGAAPRDRRTGLALLVQFHAPLLQQGQLAEAPELWALLLECLESDDGLERKRALHVLEAAVAHLQGQQEQEGAPDAAAALAQAPWGLFLKLYETLEETAVNLFEEAWPGMDVLHPPASAATNTSSAGGLAMPLPWVELLWRKALKCKHAVSQKRVAATFLAASWPPALLAALRPSTVLEVLVPAVGQPHMLRGQRCESIHPALPAFTRKYCAALPPDERAALLQGLLSVAAGRDQRAALVSTAAGMLPEAAAGIADLPAPWPAEQQAEFLRGLAAAAAVQPGYGANAVALKVFEALARAAALAVRIDSAATLALVGCWLGHVPLPLLQPGGALHLILTEWLAAQGPPAAAALRELATQTITAARAVAAAPTGMRPTPEVVTIARLALLMAGAVSLDAALQAWVQALEDGAVPPAAPLLLQLVQAATPLRPAAADAQPPWPLQTWLATVAARHAGALARHAAAVGSALLTLTSAEQLAELQAACEAGCAALQQPPSALFDMDSVLPQSFLAQRAAAALALDALAGLTALLAVPGAVAKGGRAAADSFAATAAAFVHAFAAQYPCLWEDNADLEQQHYGGEEAVMRRRVRLEVGVALLRPLISCAQGLASVDPAMASVAAPALGAVAGALRQTRGEVAMRHGGKKSSGRLASLTLTSWHQLLSWRAADALLHLAPLLAAANGTSQPAEQERQALATLVVAALEGVGAAPDGSNCLVPMLRCIRAILPLVLAHPQAMLPAVGAALAGLPEGNDPSNRGGLSVKHVPTVTGVVRWLVQSTMGMLGVQARRRTGLTAATIATCMHPCLFAHALPPERLLSTGSGNAPAAAAANEEEDEGNEAWRLHTPGGPMNELVLKLLQNARQYPRTAALFPMQLAALLAARPALGLAHAEAVCQLALFGSDDDEAAPTMGDVVVDRESAAELAALEASLDADFSAAHAPAPSAPRVAALCMLCSWARRAGAGDAAAAATGREAWRRLLTLATSDPELSAGKYIYQGLTHRRKVRVWQALAALSPLVDADEAPAALDTLLAALAVSNAASVKQYQEAAALRVVLRAPRLLRERVLPLLRDYSEQRAEAVPSLLPVAMVAALGARPGAGSEDVDAPGVKQWRGLVQEVLMAALPWCGSFVHASRTFAQLVVWRLLEIAPWAAASEPAAAALLAFFQANSDINRLRAATGVNLGLDNFNLEQALTAEGILCEARALLGAGTGGGAVSVGGLPPLEGAPRPLLESVERYLAAERAVLRRELTAHMEESARQDELRRWGAFAEGGGAAPAAQEFWQRKITPSDRESAVVDPWGAALGLSALRLEDSSLGSSQGNSMLREAVLSASTAAAAAALPAGGARQELVVVASLLDKVPNLAGLARTCEVFRAARLIIPDLAVVSDPQFAQISVSAEHWVPLEAVPPPALPAWLRRRAAEGYALVGLEQTADSTRLHDFSFHPRCVLVLGAERRGVPADVLALLDATVEIPQLGVVRSLNVHVAGAVAVYEYTRQRLPPA